jgi:hypothetical protein
MGKGNQEVQVLVAFLGGLKRSVFAPRHGLKRSVANGQERGEGEVSRGRKYHYYRKLYRGGQK